MAKKSEERELRKKSLNYVGKDNSKCSYALEIEEKVAFLGVEFNLLLIENGVTKGKQNLIFKIYITSAK